MTPSTPSVDVMCMSKGLFGFLWDRVGAHSVRNQEYIDPLIVRQWLGEQGLTLDRPADRRTAMAVIDGTMRRGLVGLHAARGRDTGPDTRSPVRYLEIGLVLSMTKTDLLLDTIRDI